MGVIASRLKHLGITFPSIAAPAGNYIPYRLSGSQLFISGQVPKIDGVDYFLGRVGHEVTPEQGYQAARLCAINIVARVNAALEGDLDRVAACLQVRGFVNAPPEFQSHPAVIDGASDLLVEVFGDKGRHARMALGAGSLPRGASVEVDAIFEIEK